MFYNQSAAITYSGDQTSGYEGGSEYFDLDVEALREQYPNMRYLVFCNNVYSGINFNECYCKAGYMLRDIQDSGEIFEPKTVQTSFTVDCESTFAYLFAIDLEANDFVWLNIARNSRTTVAGTTSVKFLEQYLNMTAVINLYEFFEMMASEIVDDPYLADVVLSDEVLKLKPDAEQIRRWDTERILALMNS